jgi:GH15 family glucan-1,4-alpha-glucosidase
MLDKEKGGHFSIGPAKCARSTTKQQYLPSSNILQTRYLNEEGVMNVVDFFPRPKKISVASDLTVKQSTSISERASLKKWLVRRVECMRGDIDVNIEVFPAFSKD